jgi:hypothetical protein
MRTVSLAQETPMNFAQWKALAEPEQRTIASRWSPYDTSDIDPLLSELVAAFRQAYPQFDVRGLGNVHGSLMLVVMRPFVCDRRGEPERFLGLSIRYTLSEPVPPGFERRNEYVWAPENYLHYVDHNTAAIREALGDSTMDREEMLSALVGMPFDEWIEQCRQFGGGYTDMLPGQRVLSKRPWWRFW